MERRRRPKINSEKTSSDFQLNNVNSCTVEGNLLDWEIQPTRQYFSQNNMHRVKIDPINHLKIMDLIDSDDGYTITKCNIKFNEFSRVIVPSYVDGKKITGIGTYAFVKDSRDDIDRMPILAGDLNIKSVVIPEGIRFIADHVFCRCRNMWNIVLPNSLEFILDGCFYDTGLYQIKIPENVFYLGDYLFSGGSPYTFETHSSAMEPLVSRILLPNSLTHIGDKSFKRCRSKFYVDDGSYAYYFAKSHGYIICKSSDF